MKVYFVTAKDSYIERDGSQSDPETFGPWLDFADAVKAAEKLKSMKQTGYSKGTKMDAYEWVVIDEREVYEDYDDFQCY